MKNQSYLLLLPNTGWDTANSYDSERVKRPRAAFQVALRSSVMGAVRFEA